MALQVQPRRRFSGKVAIFIAAFALVAQPLFGFAGGVLPTRTASAWGSFSDTLKVESDASTIEAGTGVATVSASALAQNIVDTYNSRASSAEPASWVEKNILGLNTKGEVFTAAWAALGLDVPTAQSWAFANTTITASVTAGQISVAGAGIWSSSASKTVTANQDLAAIFQYRAYGDAVGPQTIALSASIPTTTNTTVVAALNLLGITHTTSLQSETTVIVSDSINPAISIKSDSVGSEEDKIFSRVSFKFFDAGHIDKYVLNGQTKNLTNDAYSDANFQNIRGQLRQYQLNTLVAYDAAGNSTTYAFTYDPVRPSTHYISPAHNAPVSNNSTIVIGYSDDVKTKSAHVQVVGGTYGEVFELNNKSGSFEVPVSELGLSAEGQFKIRTIVTDIAGNVSIASDRDYRLDNTAPTLKINGSTESGRYFGSGRVGAAAPADDFDRLVIEQKRENGEFTHRHTYTVWGGTANLAWLGDGEYRTQVFDVAGNESVAVTFVIDTKPPAVQDLSIERALTNESTIRVNGTVTDKNLESYNIRVYNADRSALVSPWTGYTGTTNVENGLLAELSIGSLSDGDYWVRVWADDLAGNRTGISPHIYVPFTIDRSITFDLDNTVFNTATPTITGVATWNADSAPVANTDVIVVINGETQTVTTDASGVWQFTPLTALTNGTYPVTIDGSIVGEITVAVVTELGSGGQGNLDADPVNPVSTITPPGVPAVTFGNAAFQQVLQTQVAASDTDDGDAEGEVLGAQTSSGTEQTAQAAMVESTDSGWKLFGLLWYWWLLIVAALVGLWWIIAARRRRKDNEESAA